MYREMLLRKKKLEEEVENLKQSLIMAGTESPKSEEAELLLPFVPCILFFSCYFFFWPSKAFVMLSLLMK